MNCDFWLCCCSASVKPAHWRSDRILITCPIDILSSVCHLCQHPENRLFICSCAINILFLFTLLMSMVFLFFLWPSIQPEPLFYSTDKACGLIPINKCSICKSFILGRSWNGVNISQWSFLYGYNFICQHFYMKPTFQNTQHTLLEAILCP